MDPAQSLPEFLALRATDGRSAFEVARDCARLARDIIRRTADTAAVTAVKGRGNVVTETDFAVESAVIAAIEAAFPGHAVLSEETAAETASAGWLWVVDPLDGTKNFSRGLPHFAFTIALCSREVPVLGVTTHPLLGGEVTAVAGAGCFADGHAAVLRECSRLANAVVAMDLGYDAERARSQLDLARQLWPGMQSLRIPGSAALGFAGLAAGWWDLYCHADLQPWDLAAGLVIVREAGGVVLDWDGSEARLRSRGVVAGRPAVVQELLHHAAQGRQQHG